MTAQEIEYNKMAAEGFVSNEEAAKMLEISEQQVLLLKRKKVLYSAGKQVSVVSLKAYLANCVRKDEREPLPTRVVWEPYEGDSPFPQGINAADMHAHRSTKGWFICRDEHHVYVIRGGELQRRVFYTEELAQEYVASIACGAKKLSDFYVF